MGVKESKTFDRKFDETEISVLNQAFRDLARRSIQKDDKGEKCLDKKNFLLIFKFPGLLGERMFKIFDRNNDEMICFREFVEGLTVFLRETSFTGSEEDKIRCLFEVFDLTNTGSVSIYNLRTLLNSFLIPLSSTDDHLNASDTYLDPNDLIIETMIKSIFPDYPAIDIETKIGLYQFGDFINQYPELLNFIEHTFIVSRDHVNIHNYPNHAFNFEEGDKKVIMMEHIMTPKTHLSDQYFRNRARTQWHQPNTLSFSSQSSSMIECSQCHQTSSLQYCLLCGRALDHLSCSQCGLYKYCPLCGYSLSNSSLTDKNEKDKDIVNQSPLSSHPFQSRKVTQCEGYLMKLGKKMKMLKTRWLVLKDTFLYSFHSKTNLSPSSIIFLEGCYVEAIPSIQEKTKYGIKIMMSDDNIESKCFFAQSLVERDRWLKAFKSACNIRIFNDYYELSDEIGIGKFSSVYQCIHKSTQQHYAVKIIDKSHLKFKEKESLRNELAILKLLSNPRVIQFKEQFETRSQIYIVMTLINGGDLFDRLLMVKKFNENTVRTIIKRLLQTVLYLHDRGIVHRDIKPENIMIQNNELNSSSQIQDISHQQTDLDIDIVIVDFGLSKFLDHNESDKFPCGTLAYCAPEVLQKKGMTKSVDIWSVGIVTFLLLSGKLPFESCKLNILLNQIMTPLDFSDPVWSTVSNQCLDFLKYLLIVNPHKTIELNSSIFSERPTVSEALNHPWLLEISSPLLKKSLAFISPSSPLTLQSFPDSIKPIDDSKKNDGEIGEAVPLPLPSFPE